MVHARAGDCNTLGKVVHVQTNMHDILTDTAIQVLYDPKIFDFINFTDVPY